MIPRLSPLEAEKTATSRGRKVQVALDLPELPAALCALTKTADLVDVIEVGTVLCLAEGMGAVRAIRAAHPDHVLLADIRIAEAGQLLSRLAFDAGADWLTVVSGAAPSTFGAVATVAAEYGGDVQVELSDGWTWDLIHRCRDLGIAQFILHRSRDAEASGDLAWSPGDLDAIAQLSDLGGRISVTGGLSADQLGQFAGRPVEIFIAGRAIYGAEDAAAGATWFRDAVRALDSSHAGGLVAS